MSARESRTRENKAQESERLNKTFAALADPIRRSILERLVDGELTVAELAGPFDVSAPAISRHLRVLQENGLITRQLKGRTHVIRLNHEPMARLDEYMNYFAHFWRGGLERFSRRLSREQKAGKTSKR